MVHEGTLPSKLRSGHVLAPVGFRSSVWSPTDALLTQVAADIKEGVRGPFPQGQILETRGRLTPDSRLPQARWSIPSPMGQSSPTRALDGVPVSTDLDVPSGEIRE